MIAKYQMISRGYLIISKDRSTDQDILLIKYLQDNCVFYKWRFLNIEDLCPQIIRTFDSEE